MDISELTLKLLFLLIPGALSSLIFEKFTTAEIFLLHDIGRAAICGIILGFIVSACDHYKLVNRFVSRVGASSKFWGYSKGKMYGFVGVTFTGFQRLAEALHVRGNLTKDDMKDIILNGYFKSISDFFSGINRGHNLVTLILNDTFTSQVGLRPALFISMYSRF